MTDEPDAELVDLLVRAYLKGKDVEDPSQPRLRAARSTAEQLAEEFENE